MSSSSRARKTQRRAARRRKLDGGKPLKSPFVIDSALVGSPRLDLPPVDAELDRLLIERGWALCERDPNGDLYDWPPSIADPSASYAYVTVESANRGANEHRYRAVQEDGVHRTYADRLGLISVLDDIEVPPI